MIFKINQIIKIRYIYISFNSFSNLKCTSLAQVKFLGLKFPVFGFDFCAMLSEQRGCPPMCGREKYETLKKNPSTGKIRKVVTMM